MRKRPLFERVRNYLQHGNPYATRILIHPSDANEFLPECECKSTVTGEVLPVVIMGS